MQAYVLHDIGDLRRQEVDIPQLRPDEVLVKVMACGICGSDIPRIFYNGARNMPLIPGHEFSGIVEKVGEKVSVSRIGQHVGAFPLLFCGECPQCKKKHYQLCSDYDFLGSRCDGGFAEYVAVPERNLIPLGENISFEEGAMLEPLSVAVHGVKSAGDIDKKEPVAVCGLGTIGVLTVMILKAEGFDNIYAIGNKDFQRELCKKLGLPADHYIDSQKENAAKILGNIGGCGAYFECVGRNETIALGLEVSAPLGQVVLVGNPASDMNFSRDLFWKILRKELQVKGCWNSAYRGDKEGDWAYSIDLLEKGAVSPAQLITHTLSFDQLESGLLMMRDKTEPYCKVMLRFDR